MNLGDLIPRIAAMLDDQDQTYIDTDYILGFAQRANEKLSNKLRAETGYEFDYTRVELPAVQAGLPDLSQFQAPGQPLVALINPTMIEWKLPGQNPTYYSRADGPLDFPRDLPSALPQLDSWSFDQGIVLISQTSTPLDLRVTGQYMSGFITDQDSAIQISLAVGPVLDCSIALAIAKSRGQPNYIKVYGDEFDDVFDDLKIAMTKFDQGQISRVQRMCRPNSSGLGTTVFKNW